MILIKQGKKIKKQNKKKVNLINFIKIQRGMENYVLDMKNKNIFY